jgi:hypothetical protein
MSAMTEGSGERRRMSSPVWAHQRTGRSRADPLAVGGEAFELLEPILDEHQLRGR